MITLRKPGAILCTLALPRIVSTINPQRTRNTSTELKDDTTPVCLYSYPVPRAHKAMFRKEVKILVKLVALKEANESE